MKSKKGTTLLELIVYAGMLSVMSVSIALFTANFFKWSARGTVISEVDQQGTFVADLISSAIKNARAINSPSQSESASSLSLDVVSFEDDPTVFDVSSGVLRVKEGDSSWIDLTNSRVEISNFSVKNLSGDETPGVIDVEFTMTYGDLEGSSYDYSKDFKITASIR